MPGNNFDLEKGVYQAYKKDFQNGVVTVGNICNANCFFCSQKWNPPGVVQDLKRFLTIEEIGHFSRRYLKKVACVGSALHVNSGEFFFHPQALEILSMLAPLRNLNGVLVFTNGKILTEKHARLFKKFGLTPSLSLSSADYISQNIAARGNYFNRSAFGNSLSLLQKYKVDYSIWIVPSKTAFESGKLQKIINSLINWGVKTIIMHRPGYTRFTPKMVAEELSIADASLLDFVAKNQKRGKADIVFEVPEIQELLLQLHFAVRQLLKMKRIANKKKLFLCPVPIEKKLSLVLSTLKIENYKIQSVKAEVFGGNVDCAGLLLIKDYITAIDQFFNSHHAWVPEVMILPQRSFDINLEDLSMTPARTLEEKYTTPVILA